MASYPALGTQLQIKARDIPRLGLKGLNSFFSMAFFDL